MKKIIESIRKINPYLLYIIKKFYEDFYKDKLYNLFKKSELSKTIEVFKKSPNKPEWLEKSLLEFLQSKYPTPSSFVYNTSNLRNRSRNRVMSILKQVPINKIKNKNVLEIGCGKGMTCYFLLRYGAKITGIDIIDNFSETCLESGVKLIKMDASNLKFENNSFDLVYTFDAFEHFLDPEKVLQEIIRVTKNDGYIYASFGLFYDAPWGPHSYRTINFPYWQHLFPEEMIYNFAKERNLPEFPEYTFNRWKVGQFRKLWKKYSESLKIIKYKEYLDLRYLDMIRNYPSCFKSKITNFEDLIVTSAKVVFKKIA
ncbi:MAG: methyltransferase domain-containing protein [Candidatus Lokiarchaeota archaeon]|nr:methyltransferase domain-containing protein [Candidatus Lokiarchaeota archaeon]MBD3341611.1 methyltransferase domain-containing protein [Candidatus Lokiarchaeota archaeon]